VSCPTVNFCAAVDVSGNVLTYKNRSWSSSPGPIDPNGYYVSSISCPTSRFCAAVDEGGSAFIYHSGS